MLMMRNPWGATFYTGDWSSGDSRWTSELVAQVPLGLDPRTSDDLGVFTIPIETFGDQTIACVNDF
jgi:hypothetical protein